MDAINTWFDLRVKIWLIKEAVGKRVNITLAHHITSMWLHSFILSKTGFVLNILFKRSIFLYKKGKPEKIFYPYSLFCPTYGLKNNVSMWIF
jgi:hypothetical protein